MEIFYILGVVWCISFVASFFARSAAASNQLKIEQREEEARQKRLNALYGRD